jgi:hypothetical protein
MQKAQTISSGLSPSKGNDKVRQPYKGQWFQYLTRIKGLKSRLSDLIKTGKRMKEIQIWTNTSGSLVLKQN